MPVRRLPKEPPQRLMMLMTFGRQDRQTREDHARNAHAVEDRADEDRRKLLEVGGGRDEGRERIGRVEEEAEDEADRNLLDELHEKP